MRCRCEATKAASITLFRRDAELVSHVDDVNDERALDPAVFEHDVEVAERGGVRRRLGCQAAHDDQNR